MPLVISKASLDIGIVLQDVDGMVAFYRDVLGLPEIGTFPVPGGMQHRYAVGDSVIKLMVVDNPPSAHAPAGQIQGATGIRYWTAFCTGLQRIVDECTAAGASVLVPLTVASSGVRYAVLADPDGNPFELIEA